MAMTATGRRIRKRKLKAEINVVPYIDVMLVLLIIFMVTAPLMNLGVDVDLPNSKAKAIQQNKEPIVVSVDADGNYFLALDASRNESVTAQTLVAKISAVHDQNPKALVYVAGDAKANYQKVLSAMDLIQNAGFERVGLMSRPAEAPPK